MIMENSEAFKIYRIDFKFKRKAGALSAALNYYRKTKAISVIEIPDLKEINCLCSETQL